MMRIGTFVFIGWVGLVALWWISADPESAPQQAALAGQALVLVTLPYCALSSLQRSLFIASGKVADQPKETDEFAALKDIDPDLLTRPGGPEILRAKVSGGRSDEGAQV